MTDGTPPRTELIDEILAYAKDDYTGLWEVVRSVREHLPALSVEERQAFTLELLAGLLSSGRLVAGEVGAGKPQFSPWSGEVSTIIARIAEGWNALGHDPDIGDIVWFTAP
jgi:hypothetical protein